jgi:tryptophan halogenase|tara:strand:+ start:2411 stop:3838 length:1428 start_codon:yes stop_codon:yes gene_type:complete
MEIIILGGGTAGYVTALILKHKFRERVNIKVIKSKDIGIIGVGEGSTEHWSDFLNFIQVDPIEMLKECGATYKFGVMFQGWGKPDYLHSLDFDFYIERGQEHIGYLKRIVEDKKLNHEFFYENKMPFDFKPFQYHFDTFKLNTFLEKLSKQRDIEIIDDIIEDVKLSHKGISTIHSKDKKYEADFFIDCTGFKRILINKLGAKWVSYKKYLKVNSAITFQTPDEDNYNLWTLAKAMDYGWRFKIPVQGRHGNGYIFSDKYTTPEKAQAEVEKELGHKINVAKHIKFDPGRLDKTWIKNCVAIGLSANFVEPLEATSIGTSIQQAFLLMHDLQSNSESIRKNYNKEVVNIMDNVRDFVFLHYLTWKKHNWFWKNYSQMNAPPSLMNFLSICKKRLPINNDLKGSDYKLFWSRNFIQVLYGIGFYSLYKKNLEKQFEFMPESFKSMVDSYFKNNLENKYNNVVFKTHKQIINEKIQL